MKQRRALLRSNSSRDNQNEGGENATMGEPSGSLFYCLVIKKLKNALSHFAALFMPSKTYTHELASGEGKGRRKEQFGRNERILIWRDSGRIKRTTTLGLKTRQLNQ